MRFKGLAYLALAVALHCGAAAAQTVPPVDHATQTSILDLVPPDATTQHVLSTSEGELNYTATAGTIDLYQGNGQLGAKVFYTAYTLSGRDPDRPITFAFNGGPGAASAYLHLGLAGPHVIDLGAEDGFGATPRLRPNLDTWLAFTDLVFIDPVGTGWSRAQSDEAARAYYGVDRDAESLARAIAIHIEKTGHLSSPKFLLGESYGGFRAGKVATALRERQGIVLSGIVMVSPFLEGRHIASTSDDPLSAALQFPSLAAAELERTGRFTEAAQAEAERFAMTDYLLGLADPPPPGTVANGFWDRIANYTGIPLTDVARVRGYVGAIYASRTGETGKALSSYDAALAYPSRDPGANHPSGADPVLDGRTRAYAAAFVSYAREKLGIGSRMSYTLLNEEANSRWDWDGSRFTASAMGDLADMLAVNPSFQLMILHGFSDPLTPYRVSEYLFEQLPPELTARRVFLTNYRGGHMFYSDPISRQKAAADAQRFYRETGS
ncbi:S10 family peptidase [Paracoccus aestuariivivens]|uniref:S10 family peptidase n=1 Tax=Paracoccus aestuariivivens TaxID=1820333 RepID=UPI00147928F5|nr:carboxypeptidase [Paracoccus aestuariivivens]